MAHFVKVKNLPYTLEEIRKLISSCPVCCEIKPKFCKPEPVNFIKETQPFERLSMDFKGPLPSISKNRYL